jgi:hypothetical protein
MPITNNGGINMGECNVWLVKIDATKYNFIGSCSELYDCIPWHFEGVTGAKEDDVVYFYLTDSKSKSDSKVGLFKRFLCKGKIIEFIPSTREDDSFWSDVEYREAVRDKCKNYARIKITESLVDYRILSSSVNSDIWNMKHIQEDVYKLTKEEICSIEEKVIN